MNYQPQKILVTGAAGFIGANFVLTQLKQDANIRIVSFDKLTYAGNIDNLLAVAENPRHSFIEGDINDEALVLAVLREYEIDTIVHFAAESHVDNSIKTPQIFVETNVFGTFVLLDAARTYWLNDKKWDRHRCRFHHISTDEVYGALQLTDAAFTEKTAYAPNSPYSATKAGSDHLARAYFHTYGLPVTLSNCSNNYGPFQHPEKLIPTVIRTALAGEMIPIYGDGSNIRDWLYVEDHCHAVDAIIREGRVGDVYNIGGKNERNNLTLVRLICSLLDELKPREKGQYADLIHFVTDRPGHDWRYAIDNTKIQTELAWEPKETVESGMRKTVAWYLKALS